MSIVHARVINRARMNLAKERKITRKKAIFLRMESVAYAKVLFAKSIVTFRVITKKKF